MHFWQEKSVWTSHPSNYSGDSSDCGLTENDSAKMLISCISPFSVDLLNSLLECEVNENIPILMKSFFIHSSLPRTRRPPIYPTCFLSLLLLCFTPWHFSPVTMSQSYCFDFRVLILLHIDLFGVVFVCFLLENASSARWYISVLFTVVLHCLDCHLYEIFSEYLSERTNEWMNKWIRLIISQCS